MENPRADKVAVVDEVRQRFADSDGALLTEYRGLDVAAMAQLRRALREAGGEYHIYKNTLVRLATADLDAELDELLTGPTAIAFVRRGEDGQAGDAAAVAKALKEFARTNEALVVKGGVLGDKLLSAGDAQALADLPSKEVLLAQFAGLLQAPMTKLAQLLNAVPAKFAYGLQALVDAGGAPGAPTADAAAPAAAPEEAPAEEAPAEEAPAEEAPYEASEASEASEPAETETDTDTPDTPENANQES
jgi:large subunit ribosomal protein L10